MAKIIKGKENFRLWLETTAALTRFGEAARNLRRSASDRESAEFYQAWQLYAEALDALNLASVMS